MPEKYFEKGLALIGEDLELVLKVITLWEDHHQILDALDISCKVINSKFLPDIFGITFELQKRFAPFDGLSAQQRIDFKALFLIDFIPPVL